MNPTNILLILEVIDRLLASAGKYSNLARKAASEGRDITPEELDALKAEDDSAKAELDALIAAKRSGG